MTWDFMLQTFVVPSDTVMVHSLDYSSGACSTNIPPPSGLIVRQTASVVHVRREWRLRKERYIVTVTYNKPLSAYAKGDMTADQHSTALRVVASL